VGSEVRRTSTTLVLTNTTHESIVLLVKTVETALAIAGCNTTRIFFIYKFRTMYGESRRKPRALARGWTRH